MRTVSILCLDTSTAKISLALESKNGVFQLSYMGREKHAVRLVPLLDALLKSADSKPKDVDLIGLGIGPGNLTGLRIGISTVMGMASVTGAKVVQLNSLEVISKNVVTERIKVVVRRARSGFVYAQIFDSDSKEPRVYSVEEFREILEGLGDYVLVGDGSNLFEGEVSPEWTWFPTPEVLLQETKNRVSEAVPFTEIEPLYVQKSIAELNLERRRGHGV